MTTFKTTFRALSVASIAMVGMTTGISAVSAETAKLLYNSYLPPFNQTYQTAIRDFAKSINEASGGTIEVTIPDSSVAPSDRQYEMVLDGIADMAIISSDSVPQLVALTPIADLPFNSITAEAASIALFETYKTHFESFGEYKGLKVLSMHVLPGRQILSTGDDVIDPTTNLTGLKVWTPSGALTDAAVSFGAVPVHSEFGELYEYITKGTADAMFITPGSAKGARVLEFVKNMTDIPGGIGSISFAVVISEERWVELDDQQKAAILKAAEGLPGRTGAASDGAEAKAHEVMAHVKVSVPSDESIVKINQTLSATTATWIEAAKAKGLADPEAVLKSYREVMQAELAK